MLKQTFTLPLPPPWNSLYRFTKFGGMYMTKEGKAWKANATESLKEPLKGREKLADVDSPIKITLDVMQGICYKDDAQVEMLGKVKRLRNQPESKMVVTVCEIEEGEG